MNGWEVVKNGTDLGLKDIVATLVKQFGPALIHLDGNSAHCVVIVDPDENGATICDPWPDNLDQKITWEDVENGRLKFGELLYFKKAQS